MNIGILQLNSTIGDFSANRDRLLGAYRESVAHGADLTLAPELFLCGYPPRDLLLREDFLAANLACLAETAQAVGDVPLCVGFVDRNPHRPGRPLTNAAAVLHQGQVVWRQNKSLLPTYDVFDEDRYFEPSKPGDLKPFTFRGRKLGLTICEDIWNDADFWPERLYRRDPVKELMAQGAEIILNLSASPWCLGKEATRLAMLQRVARDERVPLVQVNLVGANDELIFDGNSVALDNTGAPLALARAFAEDVLVVDIRNVGQASCRPGERISANAVEGGSRVESERSPPPNLSTPSPPLRAGERGSEGRERRDAIVHSPSSLLPAPQPEAQLFAALSLGIRDYVRKCGFHSVVVGLSGGIDSALTAVLAVEGLGANKVLGVAMPARYSSAGSLADAEALAHHLGIRYEVIPIEPAFQAMEQQLAAIFRGTPPNEAEENLQSRLRGVTLMALSNKFGSLVLTTGNKSELAVGYCTLYGDMCGALAVIADVFKTDIYRLARWVNRERILIPESTLTKPPSAELRPDQTDQDSLPPYEILDAILDAYVVRNLGKAEIIALGFDAALVNDVINKVTFSEYKRRQAAPGLKVSPRAFGMGRRIPIAQRFRPSL